MSAVEVATLPAARKGATPLRFVASELGLIARRRRNQAGLAVLAAVAVVQDAGSADAPAEAATEGAADVESVAAMSGGGLFAGATGSGTGWSSPRQTDSSSLARRRPVFLSRTVSACVQPSGYDSSVWR